MTIYDDAQNIVRDVMGDFKQGEIRYVHLTPGNGPEDEPGQATETAYSINATARGVSFKYVQGGLAIASDLQVVAPVDPLYTPSIQGYMMVDGVKHKIHKLIAKPAAGTPVAYVFILRR